MSDSTLHLALFGATGGTGSHVLEQALDAGHHVTALVRVPSRLTVSHPRLTVIEGSVDDHTAVVQTVRRADTVICTLGAPPSSRSRIRERGTQVLVDAMQEAEVRRLVVQSSHGIGESAADLPWFLRRVVVPLYLKGAFQDHERQEAVVHASGLDWTLVRPPHLTDQAPAAALAFGPTYDPSQMTMKIARADVARFLLRQACSPATPSSTVVVSTATPALAARYADGSLIAVSA